MFGILCKLLNLLLHLNFNILSQNLFNYKGTVMGSIDHGSPAKILQHGLWVEMYCHLLEIAHIKRIICVYLCQPLVDGTECTTIDYPDYHR